MRIPRHLAIIMDGNGRWAEQRGLPRIIGHQRGVETVQTIVEESCCLGIEYLTLYAFSSENWGRPRDEVNALMDLLGRYLKNELETMCRQGIRLNVIGENTRLPGGVRRILEDTIEETASNRRMVLTLALSYGARDEILRAAINLAGQVRDGRIALEEIDESAFGRRLDTGNLPDPDLLIRTSGEMRISNFLLWQLAYTELVFTDTLWPEFGTDQLHAALEEYGGRQRRFGLTPAQVEKKVRNSGEGRH